jgi:hypothetical protein
MAHLQGTKPSRVTQGLPATPRLCLLCNCAVFCVGNQLMHTDAPPPPPPPVLYRYIDPLHSKGTGGTTLSPSDCGVPAIADDRQAVFCRVPVMKLQHAGNLLSAALPYAQHNIACTIVWRNGWHWGTRSCALDRRHNSVQCSILPDRCATASPSEVSTHIIAA